MSNSKFNAAAKLSMLAAGAMAAGSINVSANDIDIFEYEALGSGNEVRSELMNATSKDLAEGFVEFEARLGEGKCGEGKCGEGKCGEGEEEKEKKEGEKEGEEEESEEGEEGEEGKKGEGKCGEGKCGTA